MVHFIVIVLGNRQLLGNNAMGGVGWGEGGRRWAGQDEWRWGGGERGGGRGGAGVDGESMSKVKRKKEKKKTLQRHELLI